MNDLSKAYIKALLYFYMIMLFPFALAWGFYAAGADLRGVLASLTGEATGAYADCLVLLLGVIPGAFVMRGRMKQNGAVIKAMNEAPLSAASFQSLFLSVILTGVLGFGLFLGLAMAFLPYTPDSYNGYALFEPLREPGVVAGFAERRELFISAAPIFLIAGAVFGAFMWGTSQGNKMVRFGAWAVFVAFIVYNPLMMFGEQPSLRMPGADIIMDSAVMQEMLETLGDEGE